MNTTKTLTQEYSSTNYKEAFFMLNKTQIITLFEDMFGEKPESNKPSVVMDKITGSKRFLGLTVTISLKQEVDDSQLKNNKKQIDELRNKLLAASKKIDSLKLKQVIESEIGKEEEEYMEAHAKRIADLNNTVTTIIAKKDVPKQLKREAVVV